MKISILGGGGFLGRKIAAKLAKDGTLGGKTGHRADAVRHGRTAETRCIVPGDLDRRRRRRPAGQRDPGGDGRRLPPRRRGQRPGRSRLRPRPQGQYPRHRRGDRSLPSTGDPAEGGVHQFGGEFQRQPEHHAARQHPPDPRQQLWRAKGRRRTDPGGRIPPRLPRRRLAAASHRHRPPGPAQQGRQFLFLRHRARAAARPGHRTSGRRRFRRLGLQPAASGGLAAACGGRWTPARWGWTAASTRPASAPPSPICCKRWRRSRPALHRM